jgi:hypothetical protein
MTAAARPQRKRVRALHVGSTVLLGIAAAALVALDLLHFSAATAASALFLVAFVVAYVVRRSDPRFGLYLFLVAEVSAISLEADLATAVLYQAFSFLLLTAVITPLPRVAKLRAYVRPALLTLAIAAVSLAPGIALFYALGLNAIQAASFSGAILLALSIVLLVVRRNHSMLQSFVGA